MAPTFRTMTKLVWPFPHRLVKSNPSGRGSYVAHHVVEQRLIDALGCPPSTEVVRVVRGFVPGQEPNPRASSERGRRGTPDLSDAVVGVVLRMTATIDGQEVTVEEAGDCEDPHNWPHDGSRMKDATSDAYKRAAMRLGVALHVWSGPAFYLARKLAAEDGWTPDENDADGVTDRADAPDAPATGDGEEWWDDAPY